MGKMHTMYDNMEFKKKEFLEFPMAVPFVGGKIMPTPYNDRGKPHPIVIVQSQEELDALQGPQIRTVAVQPGETARLETEEDIRAVLCRQAEQKGVQVDKRWSVGRIEAEIRKAVEASTPAPAPDAPEAEAV